MAEKYLKWSVYWIFLISSLPFMFVVTQYSHQFRIGVKKSWMDSFYSSLSSNPYYFTDSGSITGHQFEFFKKYNWAISFHTIAGTGWFIFGFIQFNTYIRSNYLYLHRMSGYCYLFCLSCSLIGSGALLSYHMKEGMQYIWTENGAYHMYLIFYWFAGFSTGVGGLYAIKNKQINRHRQWMIFNFALCVAAGALRTLWAGFSWLYPSKNMGEINLVTFQWIVFLGLIVNIYIVSIGDTKNKRGFQRFLVHVHSDANIKVKLVLLFVCVLNTLTIGCIGCMEYAFGSLQWYKWIGYDISNHTGRTTKGLILFWICWLFASYLNIILFYYYRFNNNGRNKYRFELYFKIVSFWNFVCCIVTIANLSSFEGIYEGIITRSVFFKNTEWFWILMVVYIMITNANCLYYYFKKVDSERCYEWMFWMICGSALNFIIRYLYTFIIFGIFKVMYGNDNLQDLIASSYASCLEMVYVLGLLWMISETQINKQTKYHMVENADTAAESSVIRSDV